MTVLHYSRRLGDICRILPIARHFAAQGEQVLINCLSQYHDIFDLVSYAAPIWSPRALELPGQHFLLEIWPDRYQDFRASGKSWQQFVWSLRPEFAGIPADVVFDRLGAICDLRAAYGLPTRYNLVAPFGWSQMAPPALDCVLQLARERMEWSETWLLVEPAQREALRRAGFMLPRLLTASTCGHLPRLIADADKFLTINTATTIIAGAVRESYWHICDANKQDDYFHAKQIRLEA